MPEITVGPPADDSEIEALGAQRSRTYNQSRDDVAGWIERVREIKHDVRVVREDGKVAGGLILIPGGQWFGGRSVPMTGIGGVGIEPHRRAGGLASALMREVIAELHGKGCPLSALYPATVPVYRRVGYELAGTYNSYSLSTNVIDLRYRELELTHVEKPDASLLAPLYTERARRTSGNLDRSKSFWKRITEAPGATMHTYLLGDEGYVAFTQPSAEGWTYDLALRDVVALTPRAARRLWTFFVDHRSFASNVRWHGPLGDPMLLHLREQDWNVERSWSWMLRVLDVERALTERGYAPAVEAEISFTVSDEVIGANNTTFSLHVSGGKGEVSRDQKGRIKIDIRGLAPLYTGFLSAEELKAAGLADGPDEDLARASAIFAGPAPWLADFF